MGEPADGPERKPAEAQRHPKEPGDEPRRHALPEGRSARVRNDGVVHPSVPADTGRP